MSGGHEQRLREAGRRLDEIAAALADPETGDADAVALAREAAEIAAQVSTIVAEATGSDIAEGETSR